MADYNHNYNGDRGGDFASWIPTLIMLFCFPPAGVVMLVLKLMGLVGSQRPRASRHPYDIQREQGAAQGLGGAAPAAGKKKSAKPKTGARFARGREGRGLTIAGAIVAGVFGFGGLSELLDALSYGWFWTSLSDIFIPLGIAGVGLIMLYMGVAKGKKAKRFRKYLALIGRRESISVASMAQAMGLSVRKVCDDLQDMLDEGVIPTGYLDVGSGRLVLNDEGLREEPPAPAPEKRAEEQKPPAGMEREDAVLMEIREVNDAIADEAMSRKIDRIGEITGKIFAYLREKPDKEGQLRSFLSYYLPTTLKILRAYAQMEAQGIEGENIKSAKVRIEGMMDMVVEGFERQLDKLFAGDMMDIAADITVMEQMMQGDGLADNEDRMMGGH